MRGRIEELVDGLAGTDRVQVPFDPDLRQRSFDGQLARQARRVGVEDARGNLAGCEAIDEEVGLGKVGRGVDALQNFTDTIRFPPLSLMPDRPEIVKAAAASPTFGIT